MTDVREPFGDHLFFASVADRIGGSKLGALRSIIFHRWKSGHMYIIAAFLTFVRIHFFNELLYCGCFYLIGEVRNIMYFAYVT